MFLNLFLCILFLARGCKCTHERHYGTKVISYKWLLQMILALPCIMIMRLILLSLQIMITVCIQQKRYHFATFVSATQGNSCWQFETSGISNWIQENNQGHMLEEIFINSLKIWHVLFHVLYIQRILDSNYALVLVYEYLTIRILKRQQMLGILNIYRIIFSLNNYRPFYSIFLCAVLIASNICGMSK